jgi:hypothetical protein
VSRSGRLRHPENLYEIPHAEFAVKKQVEDAQARRVGKSPEERTDIGASGGHDSSMRCAPARVQRGANGSLMAAIVQQELAEMFGAARQIARSSHWR